MKRGKTFSAYLVDKEIRGGVWGPACTVMIKRWDPAAVIVGYSSDWRAKEDFLEAGARDFFFKGGGPSVLIGILRTILAP